MKASTAGQRRLPDSIAGRDLALDILEPVGSLDDSVRASEYAAIRKALDAYDGNRSRAASALGIDKSTFYRKLKRLGITLDMKDGRRKK